MARVIDIVEKNMPAIKELIKVGRMPLSVMCDYDIYNHYQSIKDEPSKMKRYNRVAKNFKISVNSVRKVVREFNKSA